ncbi:TPA: hypothetical protein JG872_000348 [Enterobacter hormaechei subsp. xiangfangensis]|nr:hypothetical protein [Enterobacter hormaechei subsp. xiangfangensis]HAV1860654.1 hypothetical protein [Enterobacter hormaechei subsp. xiangfangensis]
MATATPKTYEDRLKEIIASWEKNIDTLSPKELALLAQFKKHIKENP